MFAKKLGGKCRYLFYEGHFEGNKFYISIVLSLPEQRIIGDLLVYQRLASSISESCYEGGQFTVADQERIYLNQIT